MPERRYTVSEIARMRRAVEQIWLFGGPVQIGGQGISRSYMTAEKETAVEERLRTYMMNGTAPEELEREAYGGALDAG